MDSFFVVDVETANSWFESICQIGLIECKNGEIITKIDELINPEDAFDSFNIHIHGITPDNVKNSKTFPEIHGFLSQIVNNRVLASYGSFDKSSLDRACQKYNLPKLECIWLNLHSVVRRAWKDECKDKGWKLKKVCKDLSIPLLKHHNALDDAIAACNIFLKAIEISGLNVDQWIQQVSRPISPFIREELEVNPEGLLYGEYIVFTGALNMPRREAEKIAAYLGCTPQAGVNKSTTILVVGDQDLDKLNGKTKSSKHLKAEKLISDGQDIKIISESDFNYMINNQ